MIPASASITVGGAFDSTRTVSNSPENMVYSNIFRASLASSDTSGRLEKMKFCDEAQKNVLDGTLAVSVAAGAFRE